MTPLPRHALIVGFGSIGRRHCGNLQTLGVEQITVCTTTPERVSVDTAGTGIVVTNDLAAALQTRPDVALVCTPTAAHLPAATAAAMAGVPLFIEKPLSDSMEGIADLESLVAERQLFTMVGFDLRFEPGLRHIKRQLEDGRIGRVWSIQAQVGQWLPDWRPHIDYRTSYSAQAARGGGVILDLVHELDYVTWLLGPAVDVACLAGTVSHLEIDTEDLACIVIRFASGAIGTVNLDYLQRVPTRTCRVIGESGSIEWDYHTQTVRTFTPGAETEVFTYTHYTRNDRFVDEMRHLLACLDGEAAAPCDLGMGGHSLAIALAAKSAAESRDVRTVAPFGTHGK